MLPCAAPRGAEWLRQQLSWGPWACWLQQPCDSPWHRWQQGLGVLTGGTVAALPRPVTGDVCSLA